MKKIKWSVIGAGGIADRRTIPAILSDEGSELCAVMDRVEPVAKAVGEKYGVPYFTYEAEGANLYEKQIKHFREILDTGKPDYFYTDRAVHVQMLVDELYAQN